MSFFEILNTILIKPLELLFEIIYVMANRIIDNPGVSIIVLSLLMNFLVLPLYMRADAMQEEEKETEQRMRKGVAHIKKTFKGDERMMMLQTYYRQNNYKPTYVLRGAVSLFLEIPFFIAAYHFLSELQLIKGVSFGPIADLGQPDGMLVIGGLTINILPIIMTAVNLISCVIFTKGSSAKQKIQLYGMALFFLVFLYTSPSGLVFYWTLNNIFSLIKTIFYKLKNPFKVLCIMSSVAGICILVGGLCFYSNLTFRKTVFFVMCGIILQAPLFYLFVKTRIHLDKIKALHENANKKVFLSGEVFLAVLTGVLIPSAVINASPQEFVDINYFYNPLWFIVSSFCFALGIFVVWMGVFYWLAKPIVRVWFDRAIWAFVGVAVADYMFFGKNLGILSSDLKFENGLDFGRKVQLINLVVILAIAMVMLVVLKYWKKRISEILFIGVIAISAMSVFNMIHINRSVEGIEEKAELNVEETPHFSLSKTGQNVIVLMLDRAMGEYIPYLFNEKPELKEKFSGFTYYSNVISFGGFTNVATPALYGGYEYTPVEMNRRNDELLVDKQNEALKVMPVLFGEAGYDVTVCDPTYANYQWIPDLSIYDEYPDIKSYITKGKFMDQSSKERVVLNNKNKFFRYSILKIIPLCMQEVFYDQGNYNQANIQEAVDGVYEGQIMDGLFKAEGMKPSFMETYSVLESLPSMTKIANEERGTFLMMSNDTTHEPMLLQEPEYVPAQKVDNTAYADQYKERFNFQGRELKMETEDQIIHYQTNMATMIQLGKWFDYMKENDVYDNTRIILVADHGRHLKHSEEGFLEGKWEISQAYPLLMVKDFNANEFTVSEEFMTNADVPALAMNNVIEEMVNPFTGKMINMNEKTLHEQYVLFSWDISTDMTRYTFVPGTWFSVHDDMRNKNNWKLEAEKAVLPE